MPGESEVPKNASQAFKVEEVRLLGSIWRHFGKKNSRIMFLN